jgi:site-specific recombinase XerD
VVKKVEPTLAKHVRRICEYIETALVNAGEKDRLMLLRDRAIILIGFTGALRRSEIAGIDAGQLRYTDEGIVITLLDTKTDKERTGVQVPIYKQKKHCPVEAVKTWMQAAGITSGYVFQKVDKHGNVSAGKKPMDGKSIATIIKNYAQAAGLNPSQVSGHSLRRGFGTQMGRNGEPMHILMRHGRWRTEAVAREYIDAGSQFSEDNPTKRLGL